MICPEYLCLEETVATCSHASLGKGVLSTGVRAGGITFPRLSESGIHVPPGGDFPENPHTSELLAQSVLALVFSLTSL